MLKGLHHVALIVSDLEAALCFYVDTLGCAVLDRHYRAERDSWKVDLSIPGGGQLEMFTFPAAPARPSRPEARGLRHIAFAVTDLNAMIARLNQSGIETESIRIDPYTHARFTFCADPDGLPVELYEAIS